MDLKLYFDGGSRGNPGIAGCGWHLETFDGVFVSDGYKFVGTNSTNNEAEYKGLLHGLKSIDPKNCGKLIIYGDSKLVINQTKGVWNTKAS